MKLLTFTTILFIFISWSSKIVAQEERGTTIDSLDASKLNWYNLDPVFDKTYGVSTEKAYKELLSGKESKKKIIVAVIDAGVDINHEDLQGKIWTNDDEIPDNGIDDDHNGYIDDVHGWNFIGSNDGKDIVYENLEYTRIVAKYQAAFDTITEEDQIKPEDKDVFNLYQRCRTRYDMEYGQKSSSLENVNTFITRFDSLAKVLEPLTLVKTPSYEQLKKLSTNTDGQKNARKRMMKVLKRGLTPEMLSNYKKYFDEQIDYYLNTDLNARAIIGDNVDDFTDAFYGNNNVTGEHAFHGTFVSGIIAANRDNNIGVNGISTNVEIMAIRCVPDGDEEDKDVALSIKYAVDNGANIINMSFGKDFSPRKVMVDEAIKYAESKGVLMVHAAGNDNNNSDIDNNYPMPILIDSTKVTNWISVGANSKNMGKDFPARFTNYGKETVDLFAPGVDIISTTPGNRYDMADGTSFACPVVTGVAALVWSYFPELTVQELKAILLESAIIYNNKVNIPGAKSKPKTAPFSQLSVTGGEVNVYNALKLAEQKANR